MASRNSIRAISAPATALMLFTLSACATIAKSPDRQQSMAQSIATVASTHFINDPENVGRLLGLEGLVDGLEWTRSVTTKAPRGVYWSRDPDSLIRNVVFTRNEDNKDWLNIVYRDEHCPRSEVFSAALGNELKQLTVPAPHGRGLRNIIYQQFKARNGDHVWFNYRGCLIILSAPQREDWPVKQKNR